MTNICRRLGSLALITTALCAQQVVVKSEDTGRKVSIGSYSLFLDCTGNAPGPTVILLAGSGSTSKVWSKVQGEVAGFARVCSCDRMGLANVIALSLQRKRRGRSSKIFTRFCLTQGLRRHTSSSVTRSAISMRGILRTFIPRWFRG
jgi:hypothetical protein